MFRSGSKNFSNLIFNTILNSRFFPSSLKYPIRLLKRKIESDNYFRDFGTYLSGFLKDLKIENNYVKTEQPRKSAIEINNNCNLNCLMCNTLLSKRPQGYMELDVFESILVELKKIGITRIPLHTVGEPLMYKNLKELFAIIRKHKFKVTLSTNGQLTKRLKAIIYHYSREINSIRFSIDGAKPETYELIRKEGKFSKLLESLEIVHKFNKHKINYRIPVKIDAVLSITNIKEISLFFKIFSNYCWPEFINFNLITGLSPDTNYFREVFPFPNLIKRVVPCSFPFRDIYFTYDGKATLCCRDYDGDLIVGDIKKESIMEIWDGKDAEWIREQHQDTEKLIIPACKKCFEPYHFASEIVNIYIHYLYHHFSTLNPELFGKRIELLLQRMNLVIENGDINLLKKSILESFL